MSCPKQFLRIGARLFTVAAEERVGMVFQRAALGRDRPLAFAEAAIPGGGSETFHRSLLLSCSPELNATAVKIASPTPPLVSFPPRSCRPRGHPKCVRRQAIQRCG